MCYSYEFKRKCTELYRNDVLIDITKGISKQRFQQEIRKWMRIEDAQGRDALRHKGFKKVWTPKDKIVLVSKVIAGKSNKSAAFNAGINDGVLYHWVHKYKMQHSQVNGHTF